MEKGDILAGLLFLAILIAGGVACVFGWKALHRELWTEAAPGTEREAADNSNWEAPVPAGTEVPEEASVPVGTKVPEEAPLPVGTEAVEEAALSTVSGNDEEALDRYLASIEYPLEQSWGSSNFRIEQGDQMIRVFLWQEGIVSDLVSVVGGDKQAATDYEDFKEIMREFAQQQYDILQQSGLSGYHISLNMLNDTNREDVLLTYLDGEEVYDAVQDEPALILPPS